MNPGKFVDRLADISLPCVFNPYADVCKYHDTEKSPFVRRENLIAYMRAAERARTDTIWFGRDLGYRGGRRTGLALTDEVHLLTLATLLGAPSIRKATASQTTGERTAADVWGMVVKIRKLPFLWNVFPFHPYEPHNPLTNRRHNARELKACEFATLDIIEWLQPKKVVALGNDAYQALTALRVSAIYIRHPSYGGKADFARGIEALYGGQISVAM